MVSPGFVTGLLSLGVNLVANDTIFRHTTMRAGERLIKPAGAS
jgi:hypothetical protein